MGGHLNGQTPGKYKRFLAKICDPAPDEYTGVFNSGSYIAFYGYLPVSGGVPPFIGTSYSPQVGDYFISHGVAWNGPVFSPIRLVTWRVTQIISDAAGGGYRDMSPICGRVSFNCHVDHALPPPHRWCSQHLGAVGTPGAGIHASISACLADPTCYAGHTWNCVGDIKMGWGCINIPVGGIGYPGTYTSLVDCQNNCTGMITIDDDDLTTVFADPNIGPIYSGPIMTTQHVYGCTDPLATNYNPLATVNQASAWHAGSPCEYPTHAKVWLCPCGFTYVHPPGPIGLSSSHPRYNEIVADGACLSPDHDSFSPPITNTLVDPNTGELYPQEWSNGQWTSGTSPGGPIPPGTSSSGILDCATIGYMYPPPTPGSLWLQHHIGTAHIPFWQDPSNGGILPEVGMEVNIYQPSGSGPPPSTNTLPAIYPSNMGIGSKRWYSNGSVGLQSATGENIEYQGTHIIVRTAPCTSFTPYGIYQLYGTDPSKHPRPAVPCQPSWPWNPPTPLLPDSTVSLRKGIEDLGIPNVNIKATYTKDNNQEVTVTQGVRINSLVINEFTLKKK